MNLEELRKHLIGKKFSTKGWDKIATIERVELNFRDVEVLLYSYDTELGERGNASIVFKDFRTYIRTDYCKFVL